jgi:O-acetyl-ADP-ribose deacetylase (regulator of RNase III)
MDLSADEVQRIKQHYLQLPLNRKRDEYKCGSNYVPLSLVPSWSQAVHKRAVEGRSFADKVSLFRGDITALEVDAIVNAANEQLAGGGGVDGAIHAAAGHDMLQAECRRLNGCPTGQAVLTGGYRLPARYVIHTVGPIGYHIELLKQSYRNCIRTAVDHGLRTIAFPCISTGVYGFPNEPAAQIALDTIRSALIDHSNQLDRIIFCVFLQKDYDIYSKLLSTYFP